MTYRNQRPLRVNCINELAPQGALYRQRAINRINVPGVSRVRLGPIL